MEWGYKYCVRYADPHIAKKFTEVGRKFLKFLNQCLPKELEYLYNTDALRLSCNNLDKKAFRAQGKCYQHPESDFCKAFVENKKMFLKSMDQNDIFNKNLYSLIKTATKDCKPKINLISMVVG
jgi:hypothetical protein